MAEAITFRSALTHLVGAYFVFDIVKAWYATMILHIMNIEMVAPNVIEMVTSL